jgi:UDP-glucose 4-epimerase
MTGAAGVIGRAVAPILEEAWNLERSDIGGEEFIHLNVTDGDACRAAFTGVDAVVHLAANPDPSAGWDSLFPANVVGAYQVAQAAIDCGVRRLVLASSLQVVLGYPEALQVRAGDPPRPANLYGATKAWAEALGAWVAASSTTSVVALRIGYFSPLPPVGGSATARDLGMWLSPGDCADLIRSAVESPQTGFIVANGVSGNRYRSADLDLADGLAYEPKDDAWNFS